MLIFVKQLQLQLCLQKNNCSKYIPCLHIDLIEYSVYDIEYTVQFFIFFYFFLF